MKLILNSGSGKFIYCYNEHATILSYLFGYKILDGVRCGFPDNALSKVLLKLESKNIDYQLTGKNEEVLKHMEFDENMYGEIFEEATLFFKKVKVIKKINNLLEDMDETKLEEVLSELM